MSRLLRLYPAAWRERYEPELLGLLHDRPVRLRGCSTPRSQLDARATSAAPRRRSVSDVRPGIGSPSDRASSAIAARRVERRTSVPYMRQG